MSPTPLQLDASVIALGSRVFQTATVVASPAAGVETIIASLTLNEDLVLTEGVLLAAYAAFTAGTDGVSASVKLRRASVSGTIVKESGLVTVTAAALYDRAIVAFDTGAVLPNQIYVLTLLVTSGSAPSVVSAVTLAALAV